MPEDLAGQRLGKYRLIEELGRGGMAVVYKAEDETLGRIVALKVLNQNTCADPGATTRFEREARVTARLNHPNIIKIYDIGRAGGSVYFAMEYLPHASLHDIIRREGKLEVNRSIEIVQEVLRGLHCAHQAGVVHRDVKPENIMINEQGHVVLVDFGIAKTQKGVRLTQTGILLGTPYYMSPEQITGKEVKHTSDIYSTGVVLFELLTATVPFQADSTFMISYMHCTQEPPDPRTYNKDIPNELRLVIVKAMAKDPALRYQSAQEMCDELERVIRGEEVKAEEPEPIEVESHPEFAKGMAAYRAGDYGDAVDHFRAVTTDAVPVDYAATAQKWVGTCLEAMGRYADAVVEYKKVADTWPETAEADSIPYMVDGCCFKELSRGEALYESGRLAEARNELADFLAILDESGIPRDINLWVQHSIAKIEQIDRIIEKRRFRRQAAIVAGVAALFALVSLFVYFYWVNPFARYSVIASIHGARKNYVAERMALEKALELRPGDGSILFRLARSMYLAGDSTTRCIEVLREAIKKDPNLAEAYEMLGELLGRRGDWKGAARNLEAAVSLSPWPGARLLSNLGLVKERLGDAAEAVKLYRKALDADPDFAMAYNNLGVLHLHRKNFDKALTAFRQAIKKDPNLAEAHLNLGKTYYAILIEREAGKVHVGMTADRKELEEKAAREFDAALLINPDLADALYHKALVALRRDRFDTAREALRRAVELDPSNARLDYDYAQLLLKDDDTREGLRYLERAVAAEPESVTYRQALALLQEKLRIWDAAESNYDKLIKLLPDNADFYLRKAYCQKKRKKLKESAVTLIRALDLAPRRIDIEAELASVLAGLKRYGQALSHLENVLEKKRKPGWLLNYGDVLMALGRLDRGVAAYAEAAASAKGRTRQDALYRLARGLIKQGRYRDGEAALNKVLAENGKHIPSLNEKGMLLATLGRYEEALSVLRRSMELDPFQPDAARLRETIDRLTERAR